MLKKKTRNIQFLFLCLIFLVAIQFLTAYPAVASDKIDEDHDHIAGTSEDGKKVQSAIDLLRLFSSYDADKLQKLLDNGRIAKEKNDSIQSKDSKGNIVGETWGIGIPDDWPNKSGVKGTIGNGGLIILGNPAIGNPNLPKDRINSLGDLIKLRLTKDQLLALLRLARTLRHEFDHVDTPENWFSYTHGEWKKCNWPQWTELSAYYQALYFEKNFEWFMITEIRRELKSNPTDAERAEFEYKKEMFSWIYDDFFEYLADRVEADRDSNGDGKTDKSYEEGKNETYNLRGDLKQIVLKLKVSSVSIDGADSKTKLDEAYQCAFDDLGIINNAKQKTTDGSYKVVTTEWPKQYTKTKAKDMSGDMGGVIHLDDDAMASVLAGSFSGTKTFYIHELYPTVPRDFPDTRLVSGQYEFLPSESYNEPISVTLKYYPYADPSDIEVYWLDGAFGKWRKITDGRVVDTQNHTITVSTYHFSTFGVFQENTIDTGVNKYLLYVCAILTILIGSCFLALRKRRKLIPTRV